MKIKIKIETRTSPKLFSMLLQLLYYFRIQIDDINSLIRIWQALCFWSKKCKQIFPFCEGQVSCISLRWAWPVNAQKSKIERSRVTWKSLIRNAQKYKTELAVQNKKKYFVERNCRQNGAFYYGYSLHVWRSFWAQRNRWPASQLSFYCKIHSLHD